MIALIIEGTLALLLLTCILYSVRLEKRMRGFQAANESLGQSVALLSRQTKEAEDALRRFREAVASADAQLSEPVEAARALSDKLEGQIDDAEAVMNKIGRIVGAATPPQPAPAQAAPVATRRRMQDADSRSRSRFAGIG